MLYPPGFSFVKKPKRFVILSSDKSSERNLSSFFDIKKPRRIEHLQSEELFSPDPYFSWPIFHPNHILAILLISTTLSVFDQVFKFVMLVLTRCRRHWYYRHLKARHEILKNILLYVLAFLIIATKNSWKRVKKFQCNIEKQVTYTTFTYPQKTLLISWFYQNTY